MYTLEVDRGFQSFTSVRLTGFSRKLGGGVFVDWLVVVWLWVTGTIEQMNG